MNYMNEPILMRVSVWMNTLNSLFRKEFRNDLIYFRFDWTAGDFEANYAVSVRFMHLKVS